MKTTDEREMQKTTKKKNKQTKAEISKGSKSYRETVRAK